MAKLSAQTKIRRMAFEKFKLFWCMKHGIDLDEILSEYEAYRSEIEDLALPKDFLEELEGTGFRGELWPCYDEFLDTEYQEVGLMRIVLNPLEFRKYLEVEKFKEPDTQNGKIQVNTPHGTIVAKSSQDEDYPGISLFFHPAKDGKEGPGVVMEFNPTYYSDDRDPGHSEEKVTLRLYGKENPYSEPTEIFEME